MISDNAIPHCGLELGCCSRQIPYDLLAHDRQVRADAIDEYNKKLNASMDTLEEKLKDKEIRNLEDVTLSIRCGMNLLAEQLKGEKV